MDINFKVSNSVSSDERMIRVEVFEREQGFKNEFDERDKTSVHIVMYDGAVPVGCCRYYESDEDGEFYIGRVAVIKPYRKHHLGGRLLEAAESRIKTDGGTKISVSAQVRVSDFYERYGYTPIGEVYFDEYCEHIHMEKYI